MKSCRLCNSSFMKNWTSKDAKSEEILYLGLCGGCGLVQQVDLPTDEELRIYYSHNYREDYKSTHQPKAKYVYRAGRAAKDRLRFIERAGVHPRGQKLLDIGAGGGEFCYLAGRVGFAAEGIEPHIGYSEFARDQYGVAIETCGIADLKDKQAEVVTMFHVFEHLANPNDVMKKIWSVLCDDGHLIIEVPNIHQADSSPHNIYFKAHLFYYSRYSLMCAASQFFELVCVEDSNNLFMAFRKRHQPLAMRVVPSIAQINTTAIRLEQKGFNPNADQYSANRHVSFGVPTDDTRMISDLAIQVIKHLYKPGYVYKKAGVMLTGLTQEENRQTDLFTDTEAIQKSSSLMKALDEINSRFGRNSLICASSGFDKKWSMKCSNRSPLYTTSWDELPKAN